MSKLYTITLTLEHTVYVEADTDEAATRAADKELHEDGYGDLCIVASRITNVEADGPARIKAYEAAVDHANAMEKAYGYDSNQAIDARIALDEAVDNLPEGA